MGRGSARQRRKRSRRVRVAPPDVKMRGAATRTTMLDLDILQAMADEVNSGPEWCRPSNIWTELIYRQFEQLQEHGVENFKRTVNQWFGTDISDLVARKAVLESLLGSLVPTTLPNWDPNEIRDQEEARHFGVYLGLLWNICERMDLEGELALLDEPSFGNPLNVHIGDKKISIDLCKSFVEYREIVNNIGRPRGRVLEIGAGSGRLALVMGRLCPDIKYIIVDIPPALYISQCHLESVFPGEVSKFARNQSEEEIEYRINNNRFVFITTNQLLKLYKNSVDAAINIDSFGEMTASNLRDYINIIKNKVKIGGHVYIRNIDEAASSFWNGKKFYTSKRIDYNFGPYFRDILVRSWPIEPGYFEVIVKKLEDRMEGVSY